MIFLAMALFAYQAQIDAKCNRDDHKKCSVARIGEALRVEDKTVESPFRMNLPDGTSLLCTAPSKCRQIVIIFPDGSVLTKAVKHEQ